MSYQIITIVIIILPIATAIYVVFWQSKEVKVDNEKKEKRENKNAFNSQIFHCIQKMDDLPSWDPMAFARDQLARASSLLDAYKYVEFPLVLGGAKKDIVRQVYSIELGNFSYLSGYLKHMNQTLKDLGTTYPDVLQIRHKIRILSEQADTEAQRRKVICASNRFPRRYERACHLAYGGFTPHHKRENLSWNEIKVMFTFTDEELSS